MRHEGIIPALESAHAFVTAFQEAPSLAPDDVILINQSGRGDKDIFTIAEALGDASWRTFLREKVATWERQEPPA
jgi:tryptophan synthase beta chain